MFNFIKPSFIALLSSSGSLAKKFISLNDEQGSVRPILGDLNPNELHY